MKIAASILTLSIACAFLASPAAAQGDAERGAKLAYTCLGCHGIGGYRNAYPSYRVPKIGGQKAAYLVAALQGYRDGTRQHPTMQAQASSMSDEDMQDLAASETAGIEAASTCVACHGQNGIAVSPNWPTLAGQHQDYLKHALNQYRDGTRKNPVMAQMAAPLTDDDVAVLVRYYSSLEGLETTVVE
jgi:cytochrome c553